MKKPIHLSTMISVVAVLITALGVLTCSNVIYQRFYTLGNDMTREVNTQMGNEISKSVNSYIEKMRMVSEDFMDTINDGPPRGTPSAPYWDIDTIVLFDSKGHVLEKADQRDLKAGLDVASMSWFAKAKHDNGRFHLSAAHVQQLYDGDYPWVISFSRYTTWQDLDGNQRQGVVLVDLNFNELMEKCATQSEYFGYSFILTEKGEIVYHPYQQLLYAGAPYEDVRPEDVSSLPDGDSYIHYRNKNYYIHTITLDNSDWRVFSVSPQTDLFSHGSDILWDIALIVALVILIAVILAVIVSGIITRPLRKLMVSMDQVRQGDMRTASHITGFSEVTDLSFSFNEMMQRIQSLMTQLVDEQQQLRKTELKALHAQINPHFLYNTLDSVVWMAHSGEQEKVMDMVSALASFFRLGLSRGSELIPVRDELQHVKDYLLIQQIRYDNRFSTQIETNPDTLSLYTPNIILQPIVENAILHGVGEMPSGGLITIKTYCEADALILEVSDNGFGISPEKLPEIFNTEKPSGSGIGIRNVHQRIQILFGEEYGLHYESELDCGTTVYIHLPVLKGREEKGNDMAI